MKRMDVIFTILTDCESVNDTMGRELQILGDCYRLLNESNAILLGGGGGGEFKTLPE